MHLHVGDLRSVDEEYEGPVDWLPAICTYMYQAILYRQSIPTLKLEITVYTLKLEITCLITIRINLLQSHTIPLGVYSLKILIAK